MKRLLLVLICFFLFGFCSFCLAQKTTKPSTKVYPKTQLGLSYFKRFITPQGKVIDYTFVPNSRVYFLQWGTKTAVRTHPDTLTLDDAPVRNPVYEAEGKDYIVMRYGCGSPCWVGLFLPMDPSKKPRKIYLYEAYDLNNNLVAYFKNDSNTTRIIIENLKSGKKQTIRVDQTCTSGFPSACGSVEIKNNTLFYNWSPSAGKKKDNTTKRVTISI